MGGYELRRAKKRQKERRELLQSLGSMLRRKEAGIGLLPISSLKLGEKQKS